MSPADDEQAAVPPTPTPPVSGVVGPLPVALGRRAGGAEPVEAVASVFDAVGGRPFFDRLVDRFYEGVAADPLLRPLYPDDLTDSKRHMAGFLSQYWGGGSAQYSDERGHPRLRMRHGRFVIGQAEKAAWLRHMDAAVRAQGLAVELETGMLDYFAMAADHLVNAEG